ncbi:MAG: Na+/H+ antiporter NhaD and related arsenite permeases [uncultured Nocardioidaceae bacterium]|uniref:Na+/H+ antiporter NhaD and related arsenite permeases n=1 Tax=uncultured Nocardioidaceae bacterium TaxID=253824 RepID=A0A6J4LJ40_9ACTN|nr:MAG: Na+/H+ antiporter NhaD and related arsenite permeases [uncultured Nocardioidaceae bacterium]CAA9334638.1 MAG: Na+/H+ antiporter NhaD and related arsenite permeases [uncultured Nocardioidaceae bacterium]
MTGSDLQVAAAIAIFVGAYVAIATEWVPRAKAALVAAALMLVVGATNGDVAFYSEDSGVDWNVIFLLLGMMIVVSVVKQTGLFEYLAVWAAKRGRGRPYRVLVLLCIITAVASAALDNVTTVLLVAPVTLLVCDRIGVRPEGFLIAEAMASNIGGTATLIGDPPNIIIASRADLSFNDFLVNLAPLVVFLMAVFLILIRWLFRSSFTYDAERAAAVMDLEERRAIRDPRLLRNSLVVLALILVFFSLHTTLHIAPSVVALLGAGALVLVSGLSSDEYLAEVEWETLVFFAGLFIMVGSLVNLGVIEYLGERAVEAVDGRYLLASTGLLFGSAGLSGIVDNIPYVATMAPLVKDLVSSGGGDPQVTSLWWSLALGSDLGGNATAIGASANVVVTGIAARNGHPISFWHFTKYGLVVTAVTVTLSWPYLWIRYFVFG